MSKNKVVQSAIDHYLRERQKLADEYGTAIGKFDATVPYHSTAIPANKKKLCRFCHGVTEDDARGNCIACGAPRAE